jgi:hypothetical protein
MARSDPQVWTPERRSQFEATLRSHRTRSDAAKALGIGLGALDHACRAYGLNPREELCRARSSVAPALQYADPPPHAEVPPPMIEEGPREPGRDSLISYINDLHMPDHDRPLWDSYLRWVLDVQPDEIIVSEFAEYLSLSRHGGNWGASWDQDKADVRRGFVQLRSVARNARIVVQQSNHDTRLERLLMERLPQFMGSMTLPKELKFDELGIDWVGERVVLRRGRIKSLHGHQLGTGPGGMLPKMHTQRAVQLYGEPGHTVVYGHTHRHQAWSEAHEGGCKRAVNIACMRTLRPAWLAGREAGWHHQFGVAYVSASGLSNLYVVDAVNGSFIWEGRRYSPGCAPTRNREARAA